MKNIIKIKNLSFGYQSERLINNLSFESPDKCLLAIAGPNGAGKTTLIKLICGLLKAQQGAIEIHDKSVYSYSIRELSTKIALVKQEFSPAFDFNVTEIVSMARTPYMRGLGLESDYDRTIIKESLEITDTLQFASRPLSQLSGGEKQRVLIAKALAQTTDILLLDEPTSFLDMKHQVEIYRLLKKMQVEKGKTILIVTHDLNLAARYCDFMLLLGKDGKSAFGKTDDLMNENIIKEFFEIDTVTVSDGKIKLIIPKIENV